MEVVPLSPVHVASLRWRRDARSWVLTLVAKMTFALQPGEMRPSPQQERLHERDQYAEEDPSRSLVSASDMAPFKPRADVLLVGHAFAPQGGRVRSLVARLVCGSVDKAIAVYGDRTGTRGEPAAFSRMALIYERAPGGPGTANPVGVPEGRLPNLEAMRPDEAAHEGGTPVGFGPIAPGWPVRQARLRQHATFSPDEPLDDGLDPEFFNVAPPDQRLAALRNDELLALDNLHAEHARLVTRLPGLVPLAYVERGHGAQEIDLRIDTLVIDTDRARVAVTWRGQLALAHRDEQGRVLVAVVDGRQKLTYEDVKRLDHALGGDRAAPQPPPPRPSAPLPRLGGDDDDDEPNRSTVAMHVPPEIEALRAARVASMQAAPASDPARRPASIPPPPPVPGRRAPPPARRASVVDAPRHSFVDKEKTSTELFITPEHRAAVDAMPAWLAQSGGAPARPPAPPAVPAAVPHAPAPPAPAPIVIQPAIAPPAPVPAVSLSQATPALGEARSPWAAGAPAGSVVPMIAPVPIPTAAVRAPEPEHQSQPLPRPSLARAHPAEVLDLLWFDPPALPRIRARFGSIIDELEFEPLDPHHDLPVDDPAASRDRHHAFGVLTRAEPTDARGVTRAMQEAVGERGQFTPPLVVLSGDLRFLFDEVETLKVAVGAAKPLAKDDKKLTDLLESYAELLETPLLQGAPGVIDGLLKELQATVQLAKRALPVKFLDAHVERVLLEQRKYQKRKIFGGTCIRALLTVGREGGGIPAYLPESAADKLPLATEVKVRIVAEANQSQDQYETHAHALRIVVLGRALGVS
jgi:hypothetical protein